ncbi:Scr1 family TA system antitoxin-like transcriptional regulator [Streptosporangium sp. NPDC000509]|uniref:Scr1 family TA system antitoxin-like transcriptional regulator n=1 Tax=Streptosporangium sp. NPDC000509 TaxID=3366186 RepID=UPI0036BB2DF2
MLEESILRAPIGGGEVMVAQLGHLLTASAMPSVSLGIIPLGPTAPACGPRSRSSCSTTMRSPWNRCRGI